MAFDRNPKPMQFWPMAVAVAWVLLRSRPVVKQLLDRHPRKPITFTTVATYAAALKVGGQHPTPEFENTEAAFHELRAGGGPAVAATQRRSGG
jgi:hypothetical protein